MDQSETSLSQRICLYILQVSVCIFLFTTGGGAAAPQLHCKKSHSTLTSLSQSGHRKHRSSSPLIGWISVTYCWWCLFLSLLDHFCSKCFLNVMMMSLGGAGPIRGRRGWGGVIHVFAFLILFIFNIFIFSTLVTLKGLYRVQGLTWCSGTLDVNKGLTGYSGTHWIFRDSPDVQGGAGLQEGGVLWEILDSSVCLFYSVQ